MKLKDFKLRTDLAGTPTAAPAPIAPPTPEVPEAIKVTYTQETWPTFLIDNATLVKHKATWALFQYQLGTDPDGKAITVHQIVDNKLSFEEGEEVVTLAVGSVYHIAGRMKCSKRYDEITGTWNEKSSWVMFAIETV